MFKNSPLSQDRTADTPKGVCPCPSGLLSIIGLDKCPVLSGQCPVLITGFCWNMMNSITSKFLSLAPGLASVLAFVRSLSSKSHATSQPCGLLVTFDLIPAPELSGTPPASSPG